MDEELGAWDILDFSTFNQCNAPFDFCVRQRLTVVAFVSLLCMDLYIDHDK